MRKKAFAAIMVAAAAMAALFCACGSNDIGSGSDTNQSASADNTADTSGPKEADTDSEDEIVVTIWEAQWGSENYEDTLKKLAEEATAARIDGKNIRVEVQAIPWDNYYETFMTAYTTGSSPDIACQASTAPAQYNDLGVVLDLSPIIEAWKTENPELYEEIGENAILFEQDADGKQIGIPFAIDGAGLIYNKEVFEAAGITELPTNYDELTETAALIAESGVTPFAFRGDHCSLSNFLIFSNGGYNIDLDYNILLDDERAIHMLDIVQGWWDQGYIAEGSAGYSSDDVRKMLMNGDVGMIITNMPTWAPEDQREKLGVLPIPVGPDATEETKHNSTSYQAYYAYNTTKHPEETMAVLKWWYEHNDILYTEGGNSCVPLRASQFRTVFGDDKLLNSFFNEYVDNNGARSAFVYPFEHFETWYGVFDADKVSTKAIMNILTDQDYHAGLDESIAETKEIFEAYGIEP